MMQESLDSLAAFFDEALGTLLVYQFERLQYRDVLSSGARPASVYGAEHLLRLFGTRTVGLDSIICYYVSCQVCLSLYIVRGAIGDEGLTWSSVRWRVNASASRFVCVAVCHRYTMRERHYGSQVA